MARWALKILWGKETAVQFWRICSERSARLASASFKVKWQDLNKLISPFRGKRWVKNWSPTACSILTLAVPNSVFQRCGCTDSETDVWRWWSLKAPPQTSQRYFIDPQHPAVHRLFPSEALLLLECPPASQETAQAQCSRRKKKAEKASSSNAHSLLLSSCWRRTDQLLGLNQQPLSCSRYLFWLCLQGYHDKVLLGSWV